MPTPTLITELSTTASSNYPAGTESPIVLDDVQRAHAAFIAQLRDDPTANIVAPVPVADGGTGSATASAARTALGLVIGTDVAAIASPTFTGTPAAPTAALGTNTTQLATTEFAIANGLPAGSIIDFAGTTAPTGFLACPTTATNISRTTYAALFAAISTTWGAGDGSTTFGCPWFPENYAALQANSNVGTATTGEVKSHLHAMNADGANVAKRLGADGPIDGSSSTSSAEDAHYNGSQNTGNTGGTANLAAGHRVLKCVKL